MIFDIAYACASPNDAADTLTGVLKGEGHYDQLAFMYPTDSASNVGGELLIAAALASVLRATATSNAPK